MYTPPFRIFEYFFIAEKQGFFIEAGAAGGELFSNTLYFEINHNWTGLLVEPNPDWWDELKSKNRNAWILPHCLAIQKKVEIVEFDVAEFVSGIINSGEERWRPPDMYDNERKIKVISWF